MMAVPAAAAVLTAARVDASVRVIAGASRNICRATETPR
jgi:hypothetical protein